MKSSLLISSGTMLMSLYMTSCAAKQNYQEHRTVHYTAELTETHVTVTGKATNANFVNMDAIHIENYQGLWREWGGIEMRRFHSTGLDKTKTYTYDIYRQCCNDRISTEIFKIKLADQIIWDGSLCEIHHCKMKRVCVSLEDSDLDLKYQYAKCKRFPNAWTVKNNGNYIEWLCPDCVNAEKQWRLHP